MPRTRSTHMQHEQDSPPKPYLVATFDGFPGVSIPLISEEERLARGIERRDFPPFETWTPKQQEAGRKLQDLMIDETVRQYYKLLLSVMESLDPNAFQDVRSVERAIADVALAKLEDESWQPDDPLCVPELIPDMIRKLGTGELPLFDESDDLPPQSSPSGLRRRARPAPPLARRRSSPDSPPPD